MPPLKLYVDYVSQPGRALCLLCRNIGVEHEEEYVSLAKGEHKSDKYAAVNPFKKVPAVRDGNTLILESCSALRYIASKYDSTGKWYPKDLDIRVKVDEYLDWQHLNTRAHGVGYFMNKILLPQMLNRDADMTVVNKHEKELPRVEKDFTSYFLGSKPFITGDHVTIADLLAACEFEQPRAGGYTLSQPIVEYLERVKKELGPDYDKLHQASKDLAKLEEQRLNKS